jgi:hypothetical protein
MRVFSAFLQFGTQLCESVRSTSVTLTLHLARLCSRRAESRTVPSIMEANYICERLRHNFVACLYRVVSCIKLPLTLHQQQFWFSKPRLCFSPQQQRWLDGSLLSDWWQAAATITIFTGCFSENKLFYFHLPVHFRDTWSGILTDGTSCCILNVVANVV